MASNVRNIKLASVDDLFSSEESRQEDSQERIIEIPLEKIADNPDNPFQVRDDDEMAQMTESVKKYGILNPALVRPKKNGDYELVAGHRRKFAGIKAGLSLLPCIVRNLTDDEAAIAMVDSNLQRENILPGERARAYKLKLDAMNRQGARTDLTFSQVGKRLNSYEEFANANGESRNQIHRYIRLTELIPDLLQKVDSKEIAVSPAYELSFLSPPLQTDLLEVIEQEERTPSLAQAQRLKKAAQEGKLDRNGIELVMQEERAADYKLTIAGDKLNKYFPKDYTPKQKEEIIFKALELYYKKLERIKQTRECER
ncbi:MAG: ParB/RepB/Spo0J family partition protein [Christensenella sp.]